MDWREEDVTMTAWEAGLKMLEEGATQRKDGTFRKCVNFEREVVSSKRNL